jgi:hypothetical protein
MRHRQCQNIEQETCYLDWMHWLVVTRRLHQYFSAEADFTWPLILVGWNSTKSAFVRGSPESILTASSSRIRSRLISSAGDDMQHEAADLLGGLLHEKVGTVSV